MAFGCMNPSVKQERSSCMILLHLQLVLSLSALPWLTWGRLSITAPEPRGTTRDISGDLQRWPNRKREDAKSKDREPAWGRRRTLGTHTGGNRLVSTEHPAAPPVLPFHALPCPARSFPARAPHSHAHALAHAHTCARTLLPAAPLARP